MTTPEEEKHASGERYIVKQTKALLTRAYIEKKISSARRKDLTEVILLDRRYDKLASYDFDVPSLFDRCLPDQTESIKDTIERLVNDSSVSVICNPVEKSRLLVVLKWEESQPPVQLWSPFFWLFVFFLLLVKSCVLDPSLRK